LLQEGRSFRVRSKRDLCTKNNHSTTMSLYPTLEDMKVDQMGQAQIDVARAQQQGAPALQASAPSAPGQPYTPSASLYPSLSDYMGLELSDAVIQQNMPEAGQAVIQYQHAGPVTSYSSGGMVAPVTGEKNLGLMRSEVKQGVRQIIACKGQDGKIGLRVRAINKGIFVSFVLNGSAASLAGLRFGDQILQINGETLAGYDHDKVMKILKNASAQKITFALRDRPFERAITLQKDSTGHVGFVFKEGRISALVKDSSAARNGLLTEHNILEVNGQNVVGLKDKDIAKILSDADRSITLTIMPSFIYSHMVKCMSEGLVKKLMDHSIPDI